MPILQVVSCYRNPRLGAAVTVRLSRCNPPTCSGGRYSICFPTEERCRILHKETCFPFFPFCICGRLNDKYSSPSHFLFLSYVLLPYRVETETEFSSLITVFLCATNSCPNGNKLPRKKSNVTR